MKIHIPHIALAIGYIALGLILLRIYLSKEKKYKERKKGWSNQFGTDVEKDWEEKILDERAVRRGKKIYIDVAKKARDELKSTNRSLLIIGLLAWFFLAMGMCELIINDQWKLHGWDSR